MKLPRKLKKEIKKVQRLVPDSSICLANPSKMFDVKYAIIGKPNKWTRKLINKLQREEYLYQKQILCGVYNNRKA